ncbi:MAG: hypothetical protein ABI345_01770 [Jatrophihabitans sp.]
MPDTRRYVAPMIATAIAAAVMLAAIIVYFVVGGGQSDKAKGVQAFSSQELAAVSAAQTEVANLTTFSRAKFESDFKRALDGATARMQVDIKSNRAPTLDAMTKGKFDLTSKVTHAALVGPVSKDKVTGYVVLVSLNGYRSTQLNAPTQQNLQVTVIKNKNDWLVDSVDMIGVG